MSTETNLKLTPPKLLIFDWHGTLADNSGDLFPGIAETLAILAKNNFILCLATSMPQERMAALLEENELDHCFTIVQTGDMGYQKPDPQMLQAILLATDQLAVDALMIGDSVSDLIMATDAGVSAIAVLSGGDTNLTLQMAEPIAILENVNELLSLLRVH